MSLVTPGIGLLFWMLVSFLTVLFILRKFAWKPILGSLKEREDSIQKALDAAKKAQEDMAKLQADNERVIREARAERERILKEAKDMSDKIVAEAKERAQTEANKAVAAAHQAIENDKAAALNEMKNLAANLSVEIAEKLVRRELATENKQKALIDSLINETNMN